MELFASAKNSNTVPILAIANGMLEKKSILAFSSAESLIARSSKNGIIENSQARAAPAPSNATANAPVDN